MQREGHMQRPGGQKVPAVSVGPQVVRHDWGRKCQGRWWAQIGQEAEQTQMLGGLVST